MNKILLAILIVIVFNLYSNAHNPAQIMCLDYGINKVSCMKVSSSIDSEYELEKTKHFENLQADKNNPPVITSFEVKREEQGEQGVEQIIGLVKATDPDGDNLAYKFKLVYGKGKIELIDSTSFIYHDEKPGKVKFELTVTDSKGGVASKTAELVIASFDIKKLYFDEEVWKAYINQNPTHSGHKSFGFNENNPDLPNVLLMGNSISIGYTPYVQENLKGIANVYRIPANGGDTYTMLKFYEIWLGGIHWDIIHFNWGLHDLKRTVNNKLDIKGERKVSIEEYSKNMSKIVDILKSSASNLIFASTSYVPDGAEGRIRGEELLYNISALEVMKCYPGIYIDDQFSLTSMYPDEQKKMNVHFSIDGSKRQAKQAANLIIEVLNVKK